MHLINPVRLIESLKAGILSNPKAIRTELTKYLEDTLTPIEQDFLNTMNSQIAKFDINKATLNDIIKVFGEPLAYHLGNQFFERQTLPDQYTMQYPAGFSIFMVRGQIQELRFYKPGYKFQNTLQVGATLQEAIEFLGKPKLVSGRPEKFKDNILYTDIDQRKGYCYYQNMELHIRLFFEEYKISALFIINDDLYQSH